MTLPTGRLNRRRKSSGFTILEVILAIAIIVLATSVVLVNFVGFTDLGNKESPEETLHSAIRAARFQAASTRQPTTLRFDEETGSLVIESGDSFPLNQDFGKDGRGQIRFFLVAPAVGLSSFDDPADSRLETDALTFAPDRSSSPFVVEIDTGRGTTQRLVFDPFSSLVRSSP
ncbi:MAG: type II secretion system protein [Puniceicoccaceae bacterium]|nr:MAG: type II secretion system protein [Puniceicoccaceae bacterium]